MAEGKKFASLAVLQIITSLGLILFWIGFFTIGLAPVNAPACYFAYEHSFPLPDIILALAMLAAGVMLLKEKGPGRSLSLVCAGSLIFLGVLDFSFNIQNGVYAVSVGDMISNGFINLWCVVFGISIFLKLKD